MLRIVLRFAGFVALVGSSVAYADPSPWLGHQRALVLLLEWKNAPAKPSATAVHETFFGSNHDSLREFFIENSMGAFDLSGDVRDWKRSDRTWTGSESCDLGKIVSEAWRLFSPEVSIGNYDSDGDGKIDHLFVVHSGRIQSDRVGPACAFTRSHIANKTVVFQAEGIGKIGESIPIGFYLHEAGHGYFNLPDLYGNHYYGRYGIGMWGMMGLGAWGTHNQIGTQELFRVPAHFEPYSKLLIGWLEPHVITATSRRVVLRPIETTGDLVVVPIGRDQAYYLEYRSPHGFSRGHRGHGLLVWRNLELVQADGRDDLNRGKNLGRRPLPPIDENFGDDGDPFPGSANVTTFEDTKAGVRLENITHHGDRIELDVRMLPSHRPVEWKRPRRGYGRAATFLPLDF